MRKEFSIIGLFLLFSSEVSAAGVDALLERAHSLQLAERTQWQALLHFGHEAISGSWRSQADDERFFLSSDGHIDPHAELEAAIPAFFATSQPGHAQCLFPARWLWLKQQLGLTGEHDVVCPRFERWRAEIPAETVSLVFPSMYLNNPGSSFGHTFLRFDHPRSELLSRALNFAAAYDPGDDGLSYALKGVFGGYNGVFTMRRYFETVQTYSDLENRDIWEYRLDHDEAEIELLIRHVWEVADIDFDYFFFTENCSYRLLSLLDVTREGSRLSARENFPVYAMPVDTVRVLEEAGAIVSREYRPSLVAQIETNLDAMDDGSVARVMALITGQSIGSESVRELETAYDILAFRDGQESARAREILSVRSRLERTEDGPVYDALPPETAHDSARVSVAAGRSGRRGVAILELRPVFHDLLDDPDGFIEGSGISIMQTRVQLMEGDELELERLTIVDMLSLPTMSNWYRPLSWHASTGLSRRHQVEYGTPEDFLVSNSRTGAGMSFNIDDRSRWFTLVRLDLDIADELDDGYSFRGGVEIGLNLIYGSARALISMERLADIGGHSSEKGRQSVGYQYDLSKQHAIRLEANHSDYGIGELTEWSLGWNHYF